MCEVIQTGLINPSIVKYILKTLYFSYKGFFLLASTDTRVERVRVA